MQNNGDGTTTNNFVIPQTSNNGTISDGAVVSLGVFSPPGDHNNDNWLLLSNTAVWTGGTQYSSYLNRNYFDAAPDSQGMPGSSTNVGGSYQFIVTADAPGTSGAK